MFGRDEISEVEREAKEEVANEDDDKNGADGCKSDDDDDDRPFIDDL